MKIELITDFDELVSLEPSYSALLEKTGGIESFYYSIDHIRMSLEAFHLMGAYLFFIIIRNGDDLVAVLPFQLSHRFCGLKRIIRFYGEVDVYACNSYQKILAAGDQPEAIDAAVAFLGRDLARRWDLIEFKWTKMEDENIRRFAAYFPQGSVQKCPEQYFYYETRNDLNAHLGSKQVGNLRRRRRRLEEDFGSVEFVAKELMEPSDLAAVERLHSARQTELQTGGAVFEDEFERECLEDLFTFWNQSGHMHFYSLRVGGEIVAIRVMMHAARVTLGFLMAFDSRYRKYAPMRILSHEVYRYEKDRYGTERIESNWGTDINRQKKDYSSGRYDLYDIRVVNDRWLSRMNIALLQKASRLLRAMKSLANRQSRA
ncbi:GNAT family N-acetyltransferase [Pontiellaceae bacterium B1224]|nr:GNAT family N-acetyltransferase [Pontiellaceae bacterium B1224]